MHEQIRIGLPKVPTSRFPCNLPLLDFHRRGILRYHCYYARKAIKCPIWNRICCKCIFWAVPFCTYISKINIKWNAWFKVAWLTQILSTALGEDFVHKLIPPKLNEIRMFLKYTCLCWQFPPSWCNLNNFWEYTCYIIQA